MSRKTLTKYVPAGVQISHVDFREEELRVLRTGTYCKKKSSRKSITPETALLNNTSVCTVQREQHDSITQSVNINSWENLPINNQSMLNETSKQVKMKPPKTICKSKKGISIGLTGNNRNSGLFGDIKDLKVVQDLLTPGPPLNSVTVPPEKSSKKIDNESGSSNTPISLVSKSETTVSPEEGNTFVNPPKNKFMLECIKRKSELKDKFMNKTKETTFNSEVNSQQLPQKIEDQNCDCSNCDNYINCPTWCSNNISFDKSDSCRKARPLLRTTYEKRQQICYKTYNKIMLHGPVIPKPVLSVDKTQFDESIQGALKQLNGTDAKDVQSYIWPAVQRGLDVFIIGPSKSGKTLSYLPAFCSFALEKRYLELQKYKGPAIIILCFNQKKCEELQNLIKTLVSDSVEVVTVEVLAEDSLLQNNAHILITTPSTLEECLKAGRVQLKRLCHLAIESAHLVLRKYNENMQKLFKLLNELQTNRPHHKNIQVAVISEKWSVDLETLLKSLNITPLVCFDDFLEAAIYSKIQMTKKSLKNTHKIYYLVDILKNNFKTHRTVVFCNEIEIPGLKEGLQLHGIEFIVISKNLIEDDLFENEDMWCSLVNGDYKVLLCTDQVFEKTKNILGAHWIIHHDLPSKWKQFTKRFRCLAANLTSPLPSSDTVDVVNETPKRSFLIIDDLCESQPFLDFLTVFAINSMKYVQLE